MLASLIYVGVMAHRYTLTGAFSDISHKQEYSEKHSNGTATNKQRNTHARRTRRTRHSIQHTAHDPAQHDAQRTKISHNACYTAECEPAALYHTSCSHVCSDNDVYGKPYARIQPFLVGIGYAYLLHARPQRIPTRIYWPLMLLSGFLMAGIVFGPAQLMTGAKLEEWSRLTHELYVTTCRGVWALALSFWCYSMIVGTGDEPLLDVSSAAGKTREPGSYLTAILGHPAWTPLARLSYGAYLVHASWVNIFVFQLRAKTYYSDLMYVYWIIGNVVLAFALALIGYILVEKVSNASCASHGQRQVRGSSA